jgi:hypothetical protein
VIFIVDITYGWSLSLSVSFGKRTYRGIHESQALSVVGAKSCRLVIQPYDVFVLDIYVFLPYFYWPYFFSSANILSFLCGEEVVIQQCLLKVRFLNFDD